METPQKKICRYNECKAEMYNNRYKIEMRTDLHAYQDVNNTANQSSL